VSVRFSALKKSGSIEAAPYVGAFKCPTVFSALKKSGSIEAVFSSKNRQGGRAIFRFEKKRLH